MITKRLAVCEGGTSEGDGQPKVWGLCRWLVKGTHRVTKWFVYEIRVLGPGAPPPKKLFAWHQATTLHLLFKWKALGGIKIFIGFTVNLFGKWFFPQWGR